MTIRGFLGAIATLVFSAGIAFAAPTTQTSTSQSKSSPVKVETHHLMGTISSINNSDLVVSHKYNGKLENTTFVMNSATKKEGSLVKGDRATVYYQVNDKQNVATDVKANPANKS
jgi:hypothetical protein